METIKKAIVQTHTNAPRKTPAGCTITPLTSDLTMSALEWHGSKDVRINTTRPRPLITDPQDIILRVTSTCICGSDLHLYLNYIPSMQKGDVMGHEFMGIVESVGPGVKDVKVGDRVVTAFDIACGACRFCKDLQVYSGCDTTNDSVAQEALYGHKTGGIFGYSHMTGGWDGGQAQYVRVPYADTMVLKVPAHLPDLSAVLLSDILPTGWHATELGNVQEGDVVAIWGCGPVGMLAAASAFYKKASRVIIIDNNEYRLNFAKNHLSKLETINFTQTPTLPQLRKLVPDGPDVSIEAVGLHYAPPLHVAQMTIGLESDPPTILNEMIMATRKGGTLGVVGVYAGLTNGYNIGGFMEKGLKMGAGQTPVQKYWPTLLKLVESGELDPKWVVTHELPLEKAPEGYKIFNGKEDNCVKIVLHP